MAKALVGAVQHDVDRRHGLWEFLLLGADGAVSHRSRNRAACRQAGNGRQQGPPMAWGFSGNESAGITFGEWLKELHINADAPWRMVRDQIETKVGEINSERRDRY
jgi:hypothetical protein